MKITNHTQLINALIEKYNLKSYLEIGVQNPANNFDKVNIEHKSGTDPAIQESCGPGFHLCQMTSDNYFKFSERVYDLIFIDGLHHADQVKRDFENSLRRLSDNGFIVIHDVLPENEAGTKVPRETKQWWGDVYKWAMNIGSYDEIGFKTFNIDNGCMLIWRDKEFLQTFARFETDWNSYNKHRVIAMNVTNTVEI